MTQMDGAYLSFLASVVGLAILVVKIARADVIAFLKTPETERDFHDTDGCWL
jgi:hypothetical protein